MFPKLLRFAVFLLVAIEAHADIVLYSGGLGGSSGANLNGLAVTTSSATARQALPRLFLRAKAMQN
jgi:hypothetical protein